MQDTLKSWCIKIKDVLKNPFKTKSRTFYLLFFILFITIFVLTAVSGALGSFFTFRTDDVIQYYPFMHNTIDKIKSGNFSFFDRSIFAGSSVFINSYYVPMDVFTLLTLFFSYFVKVESAYAFVNMLKPLSASLLLFYYLTNRRYKNSTAFIVSLILFVSGVTEVYYVFPVYLQLIVYGVLGMIISDKFMENKKYFYLVVIFALVCVLYDFYLAYMLMAFFMIYTFIMLFVDRKVDIIGKNSFIFRPCFYYYMIVNVFLLLVGLGIGMFIFLPSFEYITNDTFRSTSKIPLIGYLFFGSGGQENFKINYAHYFTNLLNFYIPNEPHRLMLIPAGGYVREHMSYYMTIFGLISFINFFFLKGKSNNRLKFFVVLLNLLYCFTIVVSILSANAVPYVRSYFIVFFINILAMARGVENFSIKKLKVYQTLIIEIILGLGIFILLYVMLSDDSLSIHLKQTDEYTLPIFITSIGIIFVYMVIMALLVLTRKKAVNYLKRIMIGVEIACAGVVLFSFIGGLDSGYYQDVSRIDDISQTLENNTTYKSDEGFRVAYDDWATRNRVNEGSIKNNFGSTNFFHSFYDADLNIFLHDVCDNYSTSWSNSVHILNQPYGQALFGIRYSVLVKGLDNEFMQEKPITLGDMYDMSYSDMYWNYYTQEMPDLIVYDKTIDTVPGYYTTTQKMETLLNYAFLPDISSIKYTEQNLLGKYPDISYGEYLKNLNIPHVSEDDISLKGNYRTKYITSSDVVCLDGTGAEVPEESGYYSKYYKYPLYLDSSFLRYPNFSFFVANQTVRNQDYEQLFVKDTAGLMHNMYYSNLFRQEGINDYTPQYLYVKYNSNVVSAPSIRLTAYDDKAYNEFITTQAKYNSHQRLHGNKLDISLDLEASDQIRIVKTQYTYSKDWSGDYETINVDGGFLGIIIPENTTHVDTTLTFIPEGFVLGGYVSLASTIFFTIIVCSYALYKKDSKNKPNEISVEDIT